MAIYNPNNKEDQNKAMKYVQSLIKNLHKFEIKRIYPKKTVKQNAYLHILFKLFGIEYGLSFKDSKLFIKDELGYVFFMDGDNDKYYISIADMTTKQLNIFITRFRNYSSMNGIYLPSSDEYKYKHAEYDNEIYKNRMYL